MKFKSFAAAVALGAFALAGAAHAADKGTIGIAMPTKSSARWIADGDNMVKVLQAKGYKTDLQYADNDIPNQLAQIENMITKGEKVLVIAAIDGTTLSNALQKAHDAGIKVISYDRLIRGSANVDYYATFDNFKVGVLQATEHRPRPRARRRQDRPVQHRAVRRLGRRQQRVLLLQRRDVGAAALDRQGQARRAVASRWAWTRSATLRWDAAVAQARMDNLLSAFYTKKKVDAVLSPYDGLSIGIISALKGVGYGSKDLPMPVISGQDSEVAFGQVDHRSRAVFVDLQGHPRPRQGRGRHGRRGGFRRQAPEINDTKTYNNGVKVVPSYLLMPVAVDASNWKSVLVDSGYYKLNQLQ